MEHGSTVQGKRQAKKVCALLCPRHRLLGPRQPLVRIAQVPQRPSGTVLAWHTRVVPIEERRGAVLEIVKSYPLHKMYVRRSDSAHEKQCRSQTDNAIIYKGL